MSQEATAQESWHSLSAAANLLQVSERTIHRWIKSGRLESRRDEAGRRVVQIDSRQTTAGQIEAAVNRVKQETRQKAKQTQVALASACEVNSTAQRIFDETTQRIKMARRAVLAAWSLALVAVVIAVGMGVILALAGSQRAEQVLGLVDARDAALVETARVNAELNQTDLQLSSLRAQLRQLTLELQAAESRTLGQQTWATPEPAMGPLLEPGTVPGGQSP